MAWLINVKYWYDILKISRYYDNIIRWGWIYFSIIQRISCTWREGIMHKYSILYIPKQNDVAKIRNHSLLNIVRSMKTHATLPPYLWGEALSTAQYISNQIPSQYIPKTRMSYGLVSNLDWNIQEFENVLYISCCRHKKDTNCKKKQGKIGPPFSTQVI